MVTECSCHHRCEQLLCECLLGVPLCMCIVLNAFSHPSGYTWCAYHICSHHCPLNFVCSWLSFCFSLCICMTHIIRGFGSVCILVCPCVPRLCIIKSVLQSVYMTPDVRQVFQHQSHVIHLSHVHDSSHCCPPFGSLGFLNWQIFAVPVLLLPIRLPFSLKHVAECEVSYMQLQHTLVQYTPQDGLYKWMCHKVVYSCWCILHSSWFSCSHLTLLEVLLSTYAIIRRVLACTIEVKLWIHLTSFSAWINFCCEALLVCMWGTYLQLGGSSRTKDNSEVSFWKCKYNTSKAYKGRWVCSGIECLSGRIFLVPIPNCTADTLPQFHQDMDWTSDNRCQWLLVGQCAFAVWGYKHLTSHVMSMVSFIDQHTDTYTNLHEDMSQPPGGMHLLPCKLCVLCLLSCT